MRHLFRIVLVVIAALGLAVVAPAPAQAAGCSTSRVLSGITSCEYTPVVAASGVVGLVVSSGTATAQVWCTFGGSAPLTVVGPGQATSTFGQHAGRCVLGVTYSTTTTGAVTAFAT